MCLKRMEGWKRGEEQEVRGKFFDKVLDKVKILFVDEEADEKE